MARKLITLLLSAALCASLALPAFAAEDDLWSRQEPGGNYVTFRLPVEGWDDMDWKTQSDLAVRYADTKEPVPLTAMLAQNGWLFATVPDSDKDRPLEVFVGEPTQFVDEFSDWGKGEPLYDPPFGTDDLNIRGILLGDAAGTLRAKDTLSRAEAFALIVRLLSLEPAGDPGYEDVRPGDWYYDIVSAARDAGIAAADVKFHPQRPVTRAEFTTMVYRAMKRVGWVTVPQAVDVDFLDDSGAVPDWAREAYTVIGEQFGIYDVTYSGPLGDISTVYARPAQPALREEVIDLLYYAVRMLPVYPTQMAIDFGFDKEMPVMDGSTSTYPYTRMVYHALFHNAERHPQYPEKHSKSYASYQKLIAGENDLLFVAAPPSEAIVKEAEAAGVELELIPIAYDAMVFFTNSENEAEGLTTEQITEIYTKNTVENWNQLGGPDGAFVPYCRNLDSGSQALMERYFLGEKTLHPDILAETTSMAMESIITDVFYAGKTDPATYALGYSIYYYYMTARWLVLPAEDSLKLLAIDGVAPSEETIRDGSYPLADYNYVVVRKEAEEGSLARKMADFMLTPAGQGCVSNAGYGPIIAE